jgi:hypothetical protein
LILIKYDRRVKVIADGTNLVAQMGQRTVRPEYVVSITNIPGLDYALFDEKQGPRIGHSLRPVFREVSGATSKVFGDLFCGESSGFGRSTQPEECWGKFMQCGSLIDRAFCAGEDRWAGEERVVLV